MSSIYPNINLLLDLSLKNKCLKVVSLNLAYIPSKLVNPYAILL
jgi:hypothetical protein